MKDGPVLVWYWGRTGAGPLIAHLLGRHLLAAEPGLDLRFSLSSANERLEEYQDLGCPVDSVPTLSAAMSLGELAGALPRLRRAFRAGLAEVRPRVVVVPMMFGAAALLADAVGRAGARLIYVAHDAAPHPGDRAGRLQAVAQAGLIAMADQTVAVSEHVAESLRRRHPWRRNRIGVEALGALYPRPATPRAPLDPARPVRLLVPGRLVRYKGFDRLANVLRDLANPASFVLTLIGDGPEAERVRALFAGRPGVDLQVRWWDPAEADALYDAHDLLLCPYDEASQSGTICEAQGRGLPAVVTPVGALPEQVGFGRAGLVARDMSPGAFAEAVRAAARPDAHARLARGCGEHLDGLRAASTWIDRLRGPTP